jgi:hypothetical protein
LLVCFLSIIYLACLVNFFPFVASLTLIFAGMMPCLIFFLENYSRDPEFSVFY